MEHENGKTSESREVKDTKPEHKPSKRPAWFRYLFNFRFFSDEHPKISPQAVVSPKAEIADDVEIGPFCVVGPEVTIGPGCKLLNSVTIVGQTTIGKDNIFFPNSVIGTAPQDKKYKGAPTRLEIGNGNAFREAVTIHVGTEKGGLVTRIGDDNLLMVNSHVGHDAHIGSRCVLSNNVMIAGHCVVGDGVAMMGAAAVHHFVVIGKYAYIGAYSRIHHDVPPFVKVDGSDEIRGLNKVGMTRSGVFTPDDIAAVDQAYRKLFLRKRPFSQALAEFNLNGDGHGAAENGAAPSPMNPQVRHMVEFLHRRNEGKNGRYQEGIRSRGVADPVGLALAHAMPTFAKAPASAVVVPPLPSEAQAAAPQPHGAEPSANGNGVAHAAQTEPAEVAAPGRLAPTVEGA